MKKKILAVDDETHIRRVIVLKLVAAGYEVTGAVDAASGLELAKELQPDLIVTDLRMPGEMSGIDLIHAVRVTSGISKTPMILLSGSIAVVHHLQESLSDVENILIMSKPFSPRNLVKEVKQLIAPDDEA